VYMLLNTSWLFCVSRSHVLGADCKLGKLISLSITCHHCICMSSNTIYPCRPLHSACDIDSGEKHCPFWLMSRAMTPGAAGYE
jgi:hypothetical protein